MGAECSTDPFCAPKDGGVFELRAAAFTAHEEDPADGPLGVQRIAVDHSKLHLYAAGGMSSGLDNRLSGPDVRFEAQVFEYPNEETSHRRRPLSPEPMEQEASSEEADTARVREKVQYKLAATGGRDFMRVINVRA
eukprot:gnl/TRDRNA2_/TRDRNA2_166918_c0_seq2.p1 gnl/TRDRNA2_/TRDRNA2_166918_c0~~gnl/TRDRNA2_/TRDRNA2_166918_c0_seq2.p1  ORF type:complete len:136 (-),score=27.41 gnl/TRDRNA2_/TRDRNA2_166918_c0_seq2:283-690(-)